MLVVWIHREAGHVSRLAARGRNRDECVLTQPRLSADGSASWAGHEPDPESGSGFTSLRGRHRFSRHRVRHVWRNKRSPDESA